MPKVSADFSEYPCLCKCPICILGKHCGVLDNNCTKPKSSMDMPDMTDEEVMEDDIRASTGIFDPEWSDPSIGDITLFPNSLDPEEEVNDNGLEDN